MQTARQRMQTKGLKSIFKGIERYGLKYVADAVREFAIMLKCDIAHMINAASSKSDKEKLIAGLKHIRIIRWILVKKRFLRKTIVKLRRWQENVWSLIL